MATHGYKKYMKQEAQKDENSLIKIFLLSFFGMLLIFTFLIKSLWPTADTSVGDYKEQSYIEDEADEQQKKIVDDRLSAIQDEDRGKNFSDIMSKADDIQKDTPKEEKAETKALEAPAPAETAPRPQAQDAVYKVFIGSYSSADQARVAKDIIQESGSGLNPIVKCIGSNSYTLQVGIFKSKHSAESMLMTVQQNHLPGRIVQEY